jgi:general secretion pathway protein D
MRFLKMKNSRVVKFIFSMNAILFAWQINAADVQKGEEKLVVESKPDLPIAKNIEANAPRGGTNVVNMEKGEGKLVVDSKPDLASAKSEANPPRAGVNVAGIQKGDGKLAVDSRPNLPLAKNTEANAARLGANVNNVQNRAGARNTEENNLRGGSNNANDADISRVVPQTCTVAKGHFTWNFDEAELITVLRQVSDLLCKTVVVNDSINKSMKFTIIGKTPLSPKDAWDVLLAAMEAKGLALVEQGKTWSVIKREDTKNYVTPFYSQALNVQNNGEIGTLFYKAAHTTPEVLKNTAKLLASKNGIVEIIADQYILMIDGNAIIRRLGEVLSFIDVDDASNKVYVVKLQNADAKTVEKQLRDLFEIGSSGSRSRKKKGEGDAKSSLSIDKLIADDRLNSIILIADADSLAKTKEIISMLDAPQVDSTKGKIYVKRLRHADAKTIAETINNVVQQGSKSRYGRRRDEETNAIFEGEIKITAHESTNSILIVGTQNDVRALWPTVDALDVRKEQVYLEAVILDIAVNDTNQFGINAFSGLGMEVPGLGTSIGMIANPGGQSIAKGISSSVAAGSATGNIAGLGAQSIGALAVLGNFLNGGVVGISGPPIGNSQIPSFGAVLQALSTNSNVDILSTPYLLTTDNQPAEMKVGQKVPVIKGASTVGSSGVGAGLGIPLQNVSYENVDLTFKITPHVGAEDNVRLDIDQEVNELGAQEQLLNATQYRINTKSVKTTIVLQDQQTGVIGGLISHKDSKSTAKIPFLGDIPLLGWLFKTSNSAKERRSLLLIITPYIIRTDADYKKILDRKMKEREEFAKLYYGGKIRNYDPYVDYDKKAGPVSSLIHAVSGEMNKAENGGPGDGNETIISPKASNSDATKSGTELNLGGSARLTLPNNNVSAEADSGDFENFDFSDDLAPSAGDFGAEISDES